MSRFLRLVFLASILLVLSSPLTAQTSTFEEWAVPTPMAFPLHLVGATNTLVYFTEPASDKVGQLDTSTGNFTEWQLPIGTQPHGVVSSSGMMVICGINFNFLGILNPATSTGTAYFFPTPNSGPSHLDIYGSSYFVSESNGNRIGLLTPSSPASVMEWTVPTPNSQPFGIAVGSGTQVFFIERAVQKLGMLDISTNMFTEWSLAPLKEVEHLRFSQGLVYFGDAQSSALAMFNPATNTLTIWTAPTTNAAIPDVFVTPSGEVNFTERFGNKIGLLNPAMGGGTTETPTPVTTMVSPTKKKATQLPGTLTPQRHTVMPTLTTNVNGVITGGLTEWAVPTANTQPVGIFLSGGTVFFTEYAGDKIGTMTTPDF